MTGYDILPLVLNISRSIWFVSCPIALTFLVQVTITYWVYFNIIFSFVGVFIFNDISSNGPKSRRIAVFGVFHSDR